MTKLTAQQALLENYTNLDLEILPDKLRKNGFDYTLIKREARKCMYAQSKGAFVAYEVFVNKITSYRARMMDFKKRNGDSYDPMQYAEFKEAFPGDEEFGKRAWTFANLAAANLCYEGL